MGLAALTMAGTLLAACASKPSSTPGRLSVPALKLVVLDAIGGSLDYCDPDVYPVTRGTDLANARARLPEIRSDATSYRAILEHLKITAGASLTDGQILAISDAYKKIQRIDLVSDAGEYRFSVLQANGPDQGVAPTRVEGTIAVDGRLTVERRSPGEHPICPICLAMGTRIATPAGPVAVQDLRVGMAVWTLDGGGRRLRAVVLRTGHMAAPQGHQVVRIVLADGRSVLASPGHPTADGRLVGELRAGDVLDGSRVMSVTRLPYSGGQTYDLLPSGATGRYLAGGIPLATTIGAGS